MMRRKIISAVLILAALVAIVPYIFAAPDSIDGTVRSIKTNEPIGGLTIDIVNCTDESQIFNTTTTGASGTFQIDYNNTWGNYSINVSGNSYSYIDRQFKNNTHCFENGTNVTLQIYPVSTSSLNVTLKDTANSRPIPDAEIKLYRSNLPGDPPIDQSDNYRCSDGTCKTGADGSILLIIPITGTYNITIESNDYDNWNETLATFNVFSDLGKNRDYTKTLRGRGLIAGDIQDFYNGKEIEGAFVELYRHDSDPFSGENLSFSGIYNYSAVTGASGQYKIYIPPSLILSNHYDIRASHIDWTPEINYNDDPNPDGGWDSLSTDIIVRMKGKLLINGSIYDCNNGDTELSLDIYVTDKTGNGFDYYIHTDNGNFSLFVKNTTTGYNGYNITINGTEYNATVLADSQQNISTCVNGLQQINGTVKDIENEQPISNVTIVINLGDGTTYYTQTLADGTFDTDVKGGTTFSIDIDKTGYTGRSALADDDGLYETIYLTGTHHIYGYIEDKEGSKRTAGPKIENASIEILNQTTSEKIYNTTTDANGYYSIYISSEINFTISLNRNLYDSAEANYSAGEHPNSTIYLTGNTHIDGHILDESAYAIDKNITAGSTLEFMDSNGTKYILTSTAGEYSIDMAISSYNITASKTGFTTKSETGAASGSSITKDISLKGDLNITIYTTDNFSSQSIDLINMRLFDESSGIVKYESISTLNGMKNVFVDSNREYHIALYENNYLPVYELVNPNGTEFVKEYRMIAKYETRITDSENGMPVENAIVYAYHYFNQTYYPQTLNGTTLTVYVNCSGAFFDNINVTITGDTHNDSKNTTAGIATFTTVPLSNYTVEANGSLEGCSTRNVSIIIDRGGITYNTTIELDTTTIMVHVTDPLSETIYPANASYQNQTGDNITMQSFNNTYYYAGYIALGSYNVMANESDHYNNAVVCNVTAIGEVNWCNITLQPRPGNLSIYIDNTESNPITGAIVNISNGTASHQTITSAGWANFTDIESFWNLTINATGIGYQNTSQTDIYTYSNDDTTYTFTLNVTLLTIDVSDDLGILENANVSLTDPATGAILKDYLGNLLTNLTGDEGNVIFEQFNLSSYNLTINETSHDFYNQTIIIQMDQDNSMQINLDTTRVT
ncbi:MAG: carboxypeptidase-like regulatory domain-containing protein, partial [archaeon]|nr:carboxypeptidase-like regulatory domain-containing protein [archaeon]